MSDVFILAQQRPRLQAYCLRNISSVKGHSHNQINFYVSPRCVGKILAEVWKRRANVMNYSWTYV